MPSRPMIRSLLTLALVAGSVALTGPRPLTTPHPAAAARAGDQASVRRVSSTDLVVDADRTVAWRADDLPTVRDGAVLRPFGPGFLYASGDALLVAGQDDAGQRVSPGHALALDGERDLAPVAFDGGETELIALELAEPDGEGDDAADAGFALAPGDWRLTLWAVRLPAGTTGALDLADAETPQGDALPTGTDRPVLLVAARGAARVGSGDEHDATTLEAGTETSSMTVTVAEPTSVGPVGGQAAGADATVLVVTVEPHGAGDASSRPSRSPQSAGTGGDTDGGRGDATGSDGDGTTTGNAASVEPTASPSGSEESSPSVAPSPSPPPADTDGDGLTDDEEATLGTDPTKRDTDGDFLTDYGEVRYDGTDPLLADTDDDGLIDNDELYVWGTDPLKRSTDDDQWFDGEEVLTYHTSPFLKDTDGDCVGDYYEEQYFGSDPLVADTDGDGIPDGLDAATTVADPNQATSEHCIV